MWYIEQRHFQRPWTTSTADFKVMALFNAEYFRNAKRYRHSFNGISIGTYTRPTEGCHFEWPRWLSEIFNDRKRRAARAVSLRQLSNLFSSTAACSQRSLYDRWYNLSECLCRRAIFSNRYSWHTRSMCQYAQRGTDFPKFSSQIFGDLKKNFN